jgi:hypothetical protein
MRVFGTVAFVVAFLAGCPGSVTGQVDDEDVPALLSAFFIQLDETDGAFGMRAAMTSTPGGCENATRRQEAFNEAFEKQQEELKDFPEDADDINEEFADAVVQYDEQNVPTDYWTVGVGVFVEDDGDVEDEFDIEDDAGKIAVSICRINDHPRVKDRTVRRDEDCFVAEKGDVEITAFEEGATVAFTAEVDLIYASNPDKDAGDVVIEGEATYCESLETAVDDFNEIVADFAPGGD